jgi:hypothetical protein
MSILAELQDLSAAFERNASGVFAARELPPAEIATYVQAIDDAAQALRDWRQAIQTGAAAGNVPPAPPAPAAPPAGSTGAPPGGS